MSTIRPSAGREASLEVRQYFARKAEHYDKTDEQPYWVFSDDLLWGLLQRLLLPSDPGTSFTLLDAGGGTARWTIRALLAYPRARAALVDLTPEMLAVAEAKLQRHRLRDRCSLHVGNVQDLESLSLPAADFIFCFHNVLGFVEDVQAALGSLRESVAGDGVSALMFPNHYHAMHFSVVQRRLSELSRIRDLGTVKFADDMPPLAVFTVRRVRELLASAGWTRSEVYGFPITLYPGQDETTLDRSTLELASLLASPASRCQLLEIETELCADSLAAARGNNLLAICSPSTP